MNYMVSVFLDVGILNLIGKKGTENGLTYYNGSHKGDTVVGITPSSIDEKFYSVAEAMLVSEQIIIGTGSVDSLFGELVVAASLLGKRTILTNDNDVSAITKGIGINAERLDNFSIMDKITQIESRDSKEECRIDIDRAFLVNGIGTVVLGVVTKGTVKVHDKLFPSSGAEVVVKSIQSKDVDVNEAQKGTRVGLALKGVKPDDIKKGDLLCAKAAPATTSIISTIKATNIEKESIEVGKVYGFISNFSYTNATVTSIEGANVGLKPDRPIALQEGDQFMLVRERKPRIFAAGVFKGSAAP